MRRVIPLVIVWLAAGIAIGGLLASCSQEPKQEIPQVIGDGIWLVGPEMKPGLWQIPLIRNNSECVWFVSPRAVLTASSSPTSEPNFRDRKTDPGTITFRVHDGETFTAHGCLIFERLSD